MPSVRDEYNVNSCQVDIDTDPSGSPVTITMTSLWARWRLRSPARPTIVYLTVIRAQIKENIKAPRHWPLYVEFTGHRPQRASNAENVSI